MKNIMCINKWWGKERRTVAYTYLGYIHNNHIYLHIILHKEQRKLGIENIIKNISYTINC